MSPKSRRTWLAAGAATGCVLAAAQILHAVRMPIRLRPGIEARVNGRDIDAASVDRTVAGFDAALRASPLYARARVVSRMIDEELLVQHALESGAVETDAEVRAALVRTAIARVNSEVAAQPISAEDLDAYYHAHRSSYAGAASYRVTPLYFQSPDFPSVRGAESRAEQALARIHSGQAVDLLQRGSDPLPFATPAELATGRTLANYFGTPLVDALDRVSVGDATPSAPFGRGVILLCLDQRVDGVTPSLSAVRDLVQADVLRERQELALEKLLKSLAKSAHIDIAPH
jgi:hypothetical protein